MLSLSKHGWGLSRLLAARVAARVAAAASPRLGLAADALGAAIAAVFLVGLDTAGTAGVGASIGCHFVLLTVAVKKSNIETGRGVDNGRRQAPPTRVTFAPAEEFTRRSVVGAMLGAAVQS
jgi:hypothetical protein